MDPFEYMKRMQEEMDESFDRFFGRNYRKQYLALPGETATEKSLAIKEPLMDLIDEKDQYKLVVEMPGINKDDIEIDVNAGVVSIQAQTKIEQKKEDKGYFYQERRYGCVQRIIRLPAEVVPGESFAEYKNGILEIRLKKKQDAKAKEQRIQVK